MFKKFNDQLFWMPSAPETPDKPLPPLVPWLPTLWKITQIAVDYIKYPTSHFLPHNPAWFP